MKVVCIGSGNVATHMAVALKASGAELLQIWSRELENARRLASVVGAEAIADLQLLTRSADFYIISVKDDAIAQIAGALDGLNGLVVHTSGAADMELLSSFRRYGVFYPLQTFSKSRPVKFDRVPLCLEAVDADAMEQLKGIALRLGSPVYVVSSEKRRILHLAAVFACNFVNHLYALGHRILEERELDFEMLRPLIAETAGKVQEDFPEHVQTGPAVRNDEQTLLKHLALLNGESQLQDIYQTLSNSIKKTHQ
jgi:predicted short-subunit dehydrogenase-like oxidoreductase (DUF2520 family)